ncbi:MAG: hypothetical protein M0C28_14200 [Candidatus Moduliflexus flocculans]|nr:hypothetical protein [Candidatus Moduliflexus flocculans]
MTTTAIANGFKICQAFLGAKIHDAKDPGADLSAMLHQVVGSVFDLMEEYAGTWRTRHGVGGRRHLRLRLLRRPRARPGQPGENDREVPDGRQGTHALLSVVPARGHPGLLARPGLPAGPEGLRLSGRRLGEDRAALRPGLSREARKPGAHHQVAHASLSRQGRLLRHRDLGQRRRGGRKAARGALPVLRGRKRLF